MDVYMDCVVVGWFGSVNGACCNTLFPTCPYPVGYPRTTWKLDLLDLLDAGLPRSRPTRAWTPNRQRTFIRTASSSDKIFGSMTVSFISEARYEILMFREKPVEDDAMPPCLRTGIGSRTAGAYKPFSSRTAPSVSHLCTSFADLPISIDCTSERTR